jgi:hypothetical protein
MWVRVVVFVVLALVSGVYGYGYNYGLEESGDVFNGAQVADIINGLISPLLTDYPSGILSGKGIDIGADGRAFFQDLAVNTVPDISVDPSKLNPSMLNTKRGLSHDCNNKLCYFYEYALSCKAVGINMTKICAQYFMGRMLGCSVFPSPSDFYNAPSVCMPELVQVAKTMQSGVSSSSGFVKKILSSDFNETCHRNCYQNFLNAGISFYQTCSHEINVTHPVAVALSNFNTFRQQVCGKRFLYL